MDYADRGATPRCTAHARAVLGARSGRIDTLTSPDRHTVRATMPIAPITDIIEDFKAGRMVVLVDDEDRENEGDLIFAADFVTPEKINFLAKHGRGLICMPITRGARGAPEPARR